MKYLITLVLCAVFVHANVTGQDQSIADSLRPIYNADTVTGLKRLEILRGLAFNEINDPDRALEYAEELIHLAEEMDNLDFQYLGYLHKGNSQINQGDLDLVLEAYQKAEQVARKIGSKTQESTALYSQGFTYAESGEPEKARESFQKSIEILRDPEVQEDAVGPRVLGEALYNFADFSIKQGNLEEAWQSLQEAGQIFRSISYKTHLAYVTGSEGMYYAKIGDHEQAEAKMTEAIQKLEEAADYAAISEFQKEIAQIYQQRGDFERAHFWANESYTHALRLKMKEQIWKSSLLLAELDSLQGNFREAYGHLNLHMQYKDSMDLETVDMTRFERQKAEFKVLQQEKELELNTLRQKRQRAALWAIGATALLLIVFIVSGYRRYSYIRKAKDIISEERDRSEQLLLNILPKETAQELKANGKVRAKRFEAVTVLFTDFKGFTRHAESTDPEKLVSSLDYYFRRFDNIIDKYGLEKIKTLGDAYMCASGLPFQVQDHAHRVVKAALEMLQMVENAKDDPSEDHIRFEVRIGINSGPVVAGVVGTRKFAFDIWGDTVNIAARMETSSEPGKINIAEGTYQLVKDHFDCTFRGSIAVKNRGKLKMYFVEEGEKESIHKGAS